MEGVLGAVESSDHIARVTGYQNLAGLGKSTSKLAKALAKAQASFSAVPRTKTAKITETRSYKYADLGDILDMIRPVLSAEGVFFSQPICERGGKRFLVTRLQLDDEVLEDSGIEIPANLTPQEFGKYMTYYRRYGSSSFLGISTEEDTDGPQEAESKTKSFTSEQPKPKAVTKPTTSPAKFQATDEDVPGNIGDPKPSPEEKKNYLERLRKYIAASSNEAVKAFVFKTTNTEGTVNLTKKQWDQVLDPLDKAAKEGKLKEILNVENN